MTSYEKFNLDFIFLISFLLQVISLSLKTLGKVLDSAGDEFVKELFSRREETSPKRARFDGGTPGQASPPEISVKEANRAKLAFLMFRRLRDSRWEVRDSTLEFVESLMRLNNGEFELSQV